MRMTDVIAKLREVINELEHKSIGLSYVEEESCCRKYDFIYHTEQDIIASQDHIQNHSLSCVTTNNVSRMLDTVNFATNVTYNMRHCKNGELIGRVINYFLRKGYYVKRPSSFAEFLIEFKKECI